MKVTQRAAALITVASTLLAAGATTTGAVASPAPAVTSAIRGTATITVGQWPIGLAIDPDTDTLYVANTHGNTVSAISGRTNREIAKVVVGDTPQRVVVNPAVAIGRRLP
jgi:YVTN family beta-propeller protein